MISFMQSLSRVRRNLLELLKRSGKSNTRHLARQLKITREAVRQHLAYFHRLGWVFRRKAPVRAGGGRPQHDYELSLDGEHLFPKNYAALSAALMDALVDDGGPGALKRVLGRLTDAQVARWRPVLEGMDLRQKMQALKAVYDEGDNYIDVVEDRDGLKWVERNCPYLSVALARPALCSVTVNTLSRLIGYKVVREKRFQEGQGCCSFRVLTDQPCPATADFELESET